VRIGYIVDRRAPEKFFANYAFQWSFFAL